MSIKHFRLTDHARSEIARRRVSLEEIRGVLENPEQIVTARANEKFYQSRVQFGEPPMTYLVRVLVDVSQTPPSVITAYRTSKMEKYMRRQE